MILKEIFLFLKFETSVFEKSQCGFIFTTTFLQNRDIIRIHHKTHHSLFRFQIKEWHFLFLKRYQKSSWREAQYHQFMFNNNNSIKNSLNSVKNYKKGTVLEMKFGRFRTENYAFFIGNLFLIQFQIVFNDELENL